MGHLQRGIVPCASTSNIGGAIGGYMATVTDKLSNIGWEPVRKMYGPKMQRAMKAMYADLRENHPELKASEPWVMDADDYRVIIILEPEDRKRIEVSFQICDSVDYEGSTGGYTFRLDIVEEGGLIVGECSPFNYTEQVWCTTHAAIRERFELILPVVADGAGDIASLVERHNA